MTNKDKYIKDLDSLILRGVELKRGLYNELRDEYKDSFDKLSADEKEKFLKASFKDNYNSWYNESLSVIKQLMPERLDDFVMQYKLPKRKNTEISYLTYTISDYLMDLVVKDAFGGIKVNRTAAVTKFQQQYQIVLSLKKRFESSLYDIKQLVQADMMDSEIDSAKLLLKNGFLRAAGAICGVVLEKHFSTICQARGLKQSKKNPCLNDYNQLLKDEGIIDTPTWRKISYLADIRNLCDHNKREEPTKEQLKDLIDGTEKIIKTVY